MYTKQLVTVTLLFALTACARVSVPVRLEPIQASVLRPGMLGVDGGSFWMTPNKDLNLRVRVSSFFLGQTEVTHAQWQAVMGAGPRAFAGDNRPVVRVSWYSALEYLNRLSEQEELKQCYELTDCNGDASLGTYKCKTVKFVGVKKCQGYRLPTEAEWEYAAKGANSTAASAELGDIAWYISNSQDETQPVASKQPTGFGLHDMIGNVAEWTNDEFTTEYPTSANEIVDPGYEKYERPAVTPVVRGCSWSNNVDDCLSLMRSAGLAENVFSDIGFRPARSP